MKSIWIKISEKCFQNFTNMYLSAQILTSAQFSSDKIMIKFVTELTRDNSLEVIEFFLISHLVRLGSSKPIKVASEN